MIDNEKYIKYMRKNLSEREILEQLAEEASELSQAALKAIRALKLSSNPTPLSCLEASDNLKEEYVDVAMCYALYTNILPGLNNIKASSKWERWAKRLGYEE